MTRTKLTQTEKNLRAHVRRIEALKARNAAFDAQMADLDARCLAAQTRQAALLDSSQPFFTTKGIGWGR